MIHAKVIAVDIGQRGLQLCRVQSLLRIQQSPSPKHPQIVLRGFKKSGHGVPHVFILSRVKCQRAESTLGVPFVASKLGPLLKTMAAGLRSAFCCVAWHPALGLDFNAQHLFLFSRRKGLTKQGRAAVVGQQQAVAAQRMHPAVLARVWPLVFDDGSNVLAKAGRQHDEFPWVEVVAAQESVDRPQAEQLLAGQLLFHLFCGGRNAAVCFTETQYFASQVRQIARVGHYNVGIALSAVHPVRQGNGQGLDLHVAQLQLGRRHAGCASVSPNPKRQSTRMCRGPRKKKKKKRCDGWFRPPPCPPLQTNDRPLRMKPSLQPMCALLAG
eukprot:m.127350 g.127350  ORF g.127350 m.127350 type:complete len:326 (+) comp19851_c4_seq1:433-1410(+)